MPKPMLLFACGNPSRGDDALGPLLLDYVEAHCDLGDVELLADFQWQIEHALDLENRMLVLFVDASVAAAGPFDFIELEPAEAIHYTSHALSPAALMAVYREVNKQSPPPCFLLGIRGEAFELGADLSETARHNLIQSRRFVAQLLSRPDPADWRRLRSGGRPVTGTGR